MVPLTVDDRSIAAAFVAPPSAASVEAAPVSHPIDDRLGETNQNPAGMGLLALWAEDFTKFPARHVVAALSRQARIDTYA